MKVPTRGRYALVAGCAAALAALVVAVPSFAGGGKTTTCDGVLASGTYQKVVVPAGAACFTEVPVTIKGGLSVGAGATFVLGDQEHPGDNGTISGGVRSQNAASVQIHFVTINGGVDLIGGSGPVGGPFGITWNTIEDSAIHGSVNISGYNGFWQGFFRNTVTVRQLQQQRGCGRGRQRIQTNTIHGNLNCSGNTPKPQSGDSGGSPNTVTGSDKGQCKGL